MSCLPSSGVAGRPSLAGCGLVMAMTLIFESCLRMSSATRTRRITLDEGSESRGEGELNRTGIGPMVSLRLLSLPPSRECIAEKRPIQDSSTTAFVKYTMPFHVLVYPFKFLDSAQDYSTARLLGKTRPTRSTMLAALHLKNSVYKDYPPTKDLRTTEGEPTFQLSRKWSTTLKGYGKIRII